jgi:hypothetical protein
MAKGSACLGTLAVVLAGMVLAFSADGASAGEARLPSGVKSRVRRINSMLDQVEKALKADRLTTAKRKIKDARP